MEQNARKPLTFWERSVIIKKSLEAIETCAAVAHLVERHLAKVEVASSSLVGRSICGSLAQLGEHLPYKQRVSGSSPLTSTMWPGSSVG